MGRGGIVATATTDLSEHEQLARVFRALGDPTRLRILDTLVEVGEASQSELIRRIGVSQSRASDHLACLHWCGFINARRDGRVVRYSLVESRAGEFLQLARDFLDGNSNALGGGVLVVR